jgi:spore maturation protein SpmA
MNQIFFWIILSSFGFGAWRQWHFTGKELFDSPMSQMTLGLMDTAMQSVTLAFGLIGSLTFFLGLMKIAENAGLLNVLAKLLQPLMIRLFPEIPANHPAIGAMVMNLSANALGLGNAATPFGIRAMQELDSLNPNKGVATNAMVLFLAMNTASITLLPSSIIALRVATGSHNPAGVMPTILFATLCATISAIFIAKALQKRSTIPRAARVPHEGYPTWICFVALGVLLSLIPLSLFYGEISSPWILPTLTAAILVIGMKRKVLVYESFIDGAKEGLQVVFRIIPYSVAILCAISLLRSSGVLELLLWGVRFATEPLGFPAEALPMALMRPLSSAGAYAMVADILKDPQFGPDSLLGYLVSTIQGTTETTFYVLAVYFGSVQIKNMRHAVPTALLTDVAGMVAAVFIVKQMYG